jgi:hypothetical protein
VAAVMQEKRDPFTPENLLKFWRDPEVVQKAPNWVKMVDEILTIKPSTGTVERAISVLTRVLPF